MHIPLAIAVLALLVFALLPVLDRSADSKEAVHCEHVRHRVQHL